MHTMTRFLALSLTFSPLSWATASQAEDPTGLNAARAEFLHQYADNAENREQLSTILESAQKNQSVIDAITRPWEAKPWHQYFPIFLTDERLNAGLQFWESHKETIDRAAEAYQVDPEIIVSIIGIETFYGKFKGKYKVLDSLYTLGFHYPPRADFFKKELANFIRLSHEEQLDIQNLKGSYAGAMGYGQFISSSYRHYAVDFNNDGRRDLFNDPVDAIGSVANYFHRHGWKKGEQVAAKLTLKASQPLSVKPWENKKPYLKVSDILTPELSLAQSIDIDIKQTGQLIELEQASTKEYWLGLNNFYVITRYNHSPLYAMAAYQFSQELKEAYAAY